MIKARLSTIALWGTALLAAAAGHAAVAAMALTWSPAANAPSAAPPVVMINLAPLEAPQVPTEDLAPGPQAADSQPEPDPVPTAKVAESELDVPKLPEKEQAVAMLPPPVPEPRPEVKPVEHERPVEVKKEERKKTERRVASRAAAPATFEARRSAMASAPAAGAARVPAEAAASWKSELMAQLNRYKRYPSGTDRTGTVLVAFSLNHSGEVTSARLMHSSGDSALDQEAISLPRRASPLPKPPAGLSAGPITLTVPIRFDR